MIKLIKGKSHQPSNFYFDKNSYNQAVAQIDEMAKTAINKNKNMQQQISQLKTENTLNSSYPEPSIQEEKSPRKPKSTEVRDQFLDALDESNYIEHCIKITLKAIDHAKATIYDGDYGDPLRIDEEPNDIIDYNLIDFMKSEFNKKILTLISQEIKNFKEEITMYSSFRSVLSSSENLKNEIKEMIREAKHSGLLSHSDCLNDTLKHSFIEIDTLSEEKSKSLIKKIIDDFRREIELLENQSHHYDSTVMIQKIAILSANAEKKIQDLGFHPEKDHEQQGIYGATIDQLNQIKSALVKKEIDSHDSPKNIIMDYISEEPTRANILLSKPNLLILKTILPATVVSAISEIGINQVCTLIKHASEAGLLEKNLTATRLNTSNDYVSVKKDILEIAKKIMVNSLQQKEGKYFPPSMMEFFHTTEVNQIKSLSTENVIHFIIELGTNDPVRPQLITALKEKFGLEALGDKTFIAELKQLESSRKTTQPSSHSLTTGSRQ